MTTGSVADRLIIKATVATLIIKATVATPNNAGEYVVASDALARVSALSGRPGAAAYCLRQLRGDRTSVYVATDRGSEGRRTHGCGFVVCRVPGDETAINRNGGLL